jgi:hypothetical protein
MIILSAGRDGFKRAGGVAPGESLYDPVIETHCSAEGVSPTYTAICGSSQATLRRCRGGTTFYRLRIERA